MTPRRIAIAPATVLADQRGVAAYLALRVLDAGHDGLPRLAHQ
jgi:hypothetical protein